MRFGNLPKKRNVVQIITDKSDVPTDGCRTWHAVRAGNGRRRAES
jgi:hypothetical protein